jgi:hypothetical protein
MKKFEEFTSGNVTEVKSAINNGHATIITYCSCSKKTCIKPEIVEKEDIYSLYDHKSLIIVRVEDSIRVCQLKKFCKKDNNYIVIVEYVGRNKILNQLIDAGIGEGSPIYEQAENIFDKAVDFEKKIEEANKKEEDEEEFSDDVFDILNGKVKNKNKSEDDGDMSSPLDLLAKLLAVGAASKMLRTTVDPENYKWKLFKDLEEKLGRTPTFEEFINANTNLSKEEKEKLIKEHKGSDGDSFQRMVTKVLEDLEKLNKM